MAPHSSHPITFLQQGFPLPCSNAKKPALGPAWEITTTPWIHFIVGMTNSAVRRSGQRLVMVFIRV